MKSRANFPVTWTPCRETRLFVLSAACLLGCAALRAEDVRFSEAKDGELNVTASGLEGDAGKRFTSASVTVKAGAVYGFEYSGREVGSGLIVAGSRHVNVDRKGPDAGWYEYKNVYRTPGTPGQTIKDAFHLGHWHGRGEFSFKDAKFFELKPRYATFGALALGHGESIDGRRYRFDTAFSSLARNESRPLAAYFGATYNTAHWNVGADSDVRYRFELPGRAFVNGRASATVGYVHGAAPMTLEASVDEKTWTPFGTATKNGRVEFDLPAALFPARLLFVRLKGVPKQSLQVSAFSFEGDVDGAPLTAYGSTAWTRVADGSAFGDVKAPVFAEAVAPANAQLVRTADGLALWGCAADVKVFRGTPLPTARAEGLKVALAANEAESVQLVVTPRAALADVRVETSDLVMKRWGFFEKARLASSCVKAERLGYVTVAIPTDETGARGEWPDPIEPQDARAFPVKAGANQPFWITVKTPKTAQPGVYSGTLRVTADGRVHEIPLEVEVYGFALPDRLTCETCFGFSPWRVSQYHRVKNGSPAHREIIEKYVQLYGDHHVTVCHLGAGDGPTVKWRNAKDPAHAEPVFDWSEFDSAHAEMRGRFGFNAIRIPVDGLGHGFQDGFKKGVICGVPETNACYHALMAKYLGAYEKHLREKGWLADSYVYWFDEPQRKVFPQVNQGMATLKRHAPGIRRLITNSPDAELADGVNLWCPRLDLFNTRDYGKMRARGDDFWWYICCGPRAPYPTEFIDHAGCELRTWLWMTWAEKMKGVLIWETSYWTSSAVYPDKTKPQDPYADPMGWSGSGGTWGNGDGRFVYPPRACIETPYEKGQPPILDAPNASYRLAILRDGLEDYEYFALLAKKDPSHPLLKVPSSVFRHVRDFSTDPSAMRAHRALLAREIARLGAGAAVKPPAACTPSWYDGQACSYRVDKWRKVRHEAKMAEIAAHGGKDYDLVLLGDSITELWEWKAPRWGTNELVKLNAKHPTLALGYGGDGIQHVTKRVEMGELDGYRAKAVAIMIGTNNTGEKPEDMAAGVAQLIEAVKAKQPQAKIALYATFPCRQTWRHLRNQSANKLYARLADGKTVFFRDVNARLPLALFPDGLHPNEAGYAVWRADLEAFLAGR